MEIIWNRSVHWRYDLSLNHELAIEVTPVDATIKGVSEVDIKFIGFLVAMVFCLQLPTSYLRAQESQELHTTQLY